MSTTHHTRPTRPNLPDTTSVVALADWQRPTRANLQRLLDLRCQLAVTAAEYRSHSLPDVWEASRVMYSVEAMIREGWPEVHDERFPSWAAKDDALLHHPSRLVPDCNICRAVAAYLRINLEAPDAA